MSLARELFAQYGAPELWRMFGDDRVLITYEFDNVIKHCRGMLSDVRVQLVQGDDGTLEKRTIGQLTIGVDEYAVMGGVADPQTKAAFIVTDGCGNATRWSVHSLDGDAIVARTSSFVIINIMQVRAAARSARSLRE